MQAALFSGSPYSPNPNAAQFLVPAAGAVFSPWTWRRFGLSYAFLAAMIFVLFLPGYAIRSRHRFDYLEEAYSLVEALLWRGIYLAINLQLSSLNVSAQWWGGSRAASEFARPFYWTTWVLIWCLPPIELARGVRQKDRFVIAAGAIAAILTLVSNKALSRLAAAYLGPDASGHIVNRCRLLHPTLACPWPGRNSPRLYRRATIGKGQTLYERRVHRIRHAIALLNNARPANKQSGLPLRWGTFGRRRRHQ